MSETTTETAPPEKVADLVQQRAYVQGKRRSATKFVKRGIRRRLQAVEQTFFQLLSELRGALTWMQRRHEEHDELLAIVAKSALGRELSVDDLAILDEHVDKMTPKEQPKAEPDAGPGPEANPGG